MNIRTRILIGIVAVACGIAGIAYATPVVGLLVGTILSSGTINDEIKVRVHVPLPPVIGANSEDGIDGAKFREL